MKESIYDLLKEENTSEIKYVHREIQYVIALLNEVRKIYKTFFPSHGGLADFYIWRDEFEEHKRINQTYDSTKKDIWKLLEL